MRYVPERRQATLVFLVDPAGRLLLQLRDARAPVGANQWSVPGGDVLLFPARFFALPGASPPSFASVQPGFLAFHGLSLPPL
jgi:hypothetical protein